MIRSRWYAWAQWASLAMVLTVTALMVTTMIFPNSVMGMLRVSLQHLR